MINATIKQAIKFVFVGILNTLVDLGVLNILIWTSGISSGIGYSAFKGVSFTVAVINSYFLNKFWTFKKRGTEGAKREFIQFFTVSLVGFGINVGVATLVVNVIGPPTFLFNIAGRDIGIEPKIWANFGAICATLAAMTWNFLGYKFIVFKNA